MGPCPALAVRLRNLSLVAPQLCFAVTALSPLMPPPVNVGRLDESLRLPRSLVGSRREFGAGCRLVPVRNTSQIEGKAVVVAVFDGELKGLLEIERITYMEPVHVRAPQPADVVIDSRIPEVRMVVYNLWTPRGVEVVFGPRSVEGGLVLLIL